MIYFATLLGYGDNLISLSLLEHAGQAAKEIRVVGTGVTQAVADAMRFPLLLTKRMFDDTAAFYVVRERGTMAALRDLMIFRRWVRQQLETIDTLIFEKEDARTRWLMHTRGCRVIGVPRAQGAYIDRERVLRPFIGAQGWPSCAMPRAVARRMLINPSARAQRRMLPLGVVERALQVAATVGTAVSLIDIDGRYEALRCRVHTYLRSPPLMEAVAAIREADCYLGPDSFFMHLAYYFNIPFLAFFWPTDMYFAPPGMLEQGNYAFYSEVGDDDRFTGKLHRLLLPE